jgi:hypothetical protein
MVCPFTQTASPSRPHGQRTKCPVTVAVALDGTARAWRSACPSIGAWWLCPGKDIAFCLALLLMGFAPVHSNGQGSFGHHPGKLKPG